VTPGVGVTVAGTVCVTLGSACVGVSGGTATAVAEGNGLGVAGGGVGGISTEICTVPQAASSDSVIIIVNFLIHCMPGKNSLV
jgi:hypothetical protein